MPLEDSSQRPYPLYNTSFTLHRLSPLYISDTPLTTPILQHHARRFREVLVGDVLRGVRVGLENDAITKAGALKRVAWQLLPGEEAWNKLLEDDETSLDETTFAMEHNRGVLVTIEYEKNTYSGILLKKEDGETEEGFEHFPLLLTKMPGSLRETFVDFLSTTFDTRISSLHLSNTYVTDSFERYLSDICVTDEGEEMEYTESSRFLRSIIKEAEIFVGFDLPGRSGALKTIEIHLVREDLPRLLARGKRLAGQARTPSFMEALTVYVRGHLALDLEHDRVRIVRIACGAFVLGAEGRVKLTQPPAGNEFADQQLRATRGLIDELVRTAVGGFSTREVP